MWPRYLTLTLTDDLDLGTTWKSHVKYENSVSSHSLATVNLFPHDKTLDQTKLKAFADDKLNVTKIIISVFDSVENIVRKGEIAVQAISPFPTMFSKAFISRPVKRCHCVGMA